MIGKEVRYIQVTVGYSTHVPSNDNGTKLVEIATETNMIVKSIFYKGKRYAKRTWSEPSGRAYNQIDHVFVEKKDFRTITAVKSRRGATFDTHHVWWLQK